MKHLPLIILMLILASYRPFGDINGDYRVSITDLVILHRITLGIDYTPLQRIRADLNRDGVVDELDLKILQTFLANKRKEFKYETNHDQMLFKWYYRY